MKSRPNISKVLLSLFGSNGLYTAYNANKAIPFIYCNITVQLYITLLNYKNDNLLPCSYLP